jgi:hypothetical protein
MISMPHPPEDRLIDLLHGLLSPTEKQATMDHLAECTECEDLFRTLVREQEMVKAAPGPVIRDGIAVLEKAPRSHHRTRWTLVAAAAALAIAAGVFFSMRPGQPKDYWIQSDAVVTIQRGEDQAASPQLTAAFASYSQHNAREAVQRLRDAPVPDDEMLSSLRSLLLASALLNDDQPKECLVELQRLNVDTLPPPWRSEGRWLEYLALRATGETVKARERLEVLAKDEGKIGARARGELERLHGR